MQDTLSSLGILHRAPAWRDLARSAAACIQELRVQSSPLLAETETEAPPPTPVAASYASAGTTCLVMGLLLLVLVARRLRGQWRRPVPR